MDLKKLVVSTVLALTASATLLVADAQPVEAQTCPWCQVFYGSGFPEHNFPGNGQGWIGVLFPHSEWTTGNCMSHPGCDSDDEDLEEELLALSLADRGVVLKALLAEGHIVADRRGLPLLRDCKGGLSPISNEKLRAWIAEVDEQ